MKREFRYSQSLYMKMIEKRRQTNRYLILIALVILVILGLIQKRSADITIPDPILYGGIIAVAVVSIVMSFARLYFEKAKAMNSKLIFDGSRLQYIHVKSAGDGTKNNITGYRE